MRRILPLVVLLAPLALAQKPTSTLSGHVFYADTNGPARLANVTLEPAKDIDGYQATASAGHTAHLSQVKTLPDGSFSLPEVAPGTYYVFAAAPGYVSPLDALGLSDAELRKPDKATKERIAAAIPRVVVQAGLSASVELTLARGGAVAGTVLYDDGSPASGLHVSLLVRDKKGKWSEPGSGAAPFVTQEIATDDRGHYRIAGLPGREYLVKVELSLTHLSFQLGSDGSAWSSGDAGTTVPVYSGSVLREKEAVPFRLRLGEERPGEDLEIPLNKLHSIAGVLTAADGHVLNHGSVELLYADDKTEAAKCSLPKDDAAFALHFVPEGDYLLKVTDAADVEYKQVPSPAGQFPEFQTETHTLHSYGSAEQPLHVGSGDLTGVAVAVPEKDAKVAQTAEATGP